VVEPQFCQLALNPYFTHPDFCDFEENGVFQQPQAITLKCPAQGHDECMAIYRHS
jgi:hypothetical protein